MTLPLDTILCGDCLAVLKTLPDESVHCCVTSPPYYGLRDYGMDAQIGREDSPEEYIAQLTAVFREVWRVLRPDGTLWVNIADSYCGTNSKGSTRDPKYPQGRNGQSVSLSRVVKNCKPKDLIGIPWMLAFCCAARAGICAMTLSGQRETRCRKAPKTAAPAAMSIFFCLPRVRSTILTALP